MKRRKVDKEARIFNKEWTEKYFFIEHFGKPVCLICNNSVSVNKEFNIKRHFDTRHDQYKQFNGQTRTDKIDRLKAA